ncbi:ATP-dependent helicase/nuclease subunit B [Sphingomonas sp. BE270]|jgi:ATP-dependent helicase/nuclease subunit B|uniref:double-strand break repair protein AddB n=1 Tax=unclassified Sphingomonas TaxID=196159 RepID=UPI0010F60C34|nr:MULTISPECIES: double-strand break repair protein AddB [unclassified Sphingomonas]MDR6849213.1 ATP-dependent helicase/nuclease subunit B [Sphingomonas sp. BE137]MDR7259474.1 ATP-dependent helicase/nuclease subunit B [Sphingomonas sp. BE270]
MVEVKGPRLFTIPAHRAFADALAAGLIRQFGGDDLGLARGLVLLPNNRAKRALTDAFVRASAGGLLLPRMVAIGDPALEEAVGAALDPADDPVPVPPAVAPLQRRMILARLVSEERARIGQVVDAAEAVRLAGELARTLDQLLVEEIPPRRLREIELNEAMSAHWQRALDLFAVVLDRWPAELQRIGRIDAAERRGLLLQRLAERWDRTPPAGFVCAAGVTDSAPAVARLLRCVADSPRGMVVLADLATGMDEVEWQALGPHAPDPATGLTRRSIETHPQFHLKLLLERMSVNRSEVRLWRDGSDHDATVARGKAVANALASAEFTAKWTTLGAEQRRLGGIAAAELATPGEEAQAIALALREVAETPGRTGALVTPDRGLARRVAAHCARWGIAIDDSAGRPLSILPSGTLLTALAEAATQRFAPLALLTLLKHPLVRFGDARREWLDGVRALDRVLRGPRPAAGLVGIDLHLRTARRAEAPAAWWGEARALLEPIERVFDGGARPIADLLAALREAAQALCGDALWAGPAGRAAAELLREAEDHAAHGPAVIEPASLGPLLKTLMDEVAVRPQQGGHPRLAIYGLIEARLQTADVMILGGLNEGTWPGLPAPDPWLAPRIRTELGLPGLDRGVGMAGHDLAQALGAPAALMTRARRGGTQPAIASRFWLRLQALAGDRFERATALEGWARALDDPGAHVPAAKPMPEPPAERRPKAIAVTDVDRLKADPYAFYAKRILGLTQLDPVDADPSAAWRGTAVHDILERWAREDACALDKLHERARAMFDGAHPMQRALWRPRLMEAIDWIVAQMGKNVDSGRTVLAVEQSGEIAIAGVTLTGKFDRIDRLPDGALAVIDYKTGKPPSPAAVREGFSLQLGLLGLIAERGGYAGIAGKARGFEYWSLSKKGDAFGYVTSPVDAEGKGDKVVPEDFTTLAARHFSDAVADWLTGTRAFEAKLHPDYAPYAEYDQLMRRDEWYGRE